MGDNNGDNSNNNLHYLVGALAGVFAGICDKYYRGVNVPKSEKEEGAIISIIDSA